MPKSLILYVIMTCTRERAYIFMLNLQRGLISERDLYQREGLTYRKIRLYIPFLVFFSKRCKNSKFLAFFASNFYSASRAFQLLKQQAIVHSNDYELTQRRCDLISTVFFYPTFSLCIVGPYLDQIIFRFAPPCDERVVCTSRVSLFSKK